MAQVWLVAGDFDWCQMYIVEHVMCIHWTSCLKGFVEGEQIQTLNGESIMCFVWWVSCWMHCSYMSNRSHIMHLMFP